jgi:hypothetical protein
MASSATPNFVARMEDFIHGASTTVAPTTVAPTRVVSPTQALTQYPTPAPTELPTAYPTFSATLLPTEAPCRDGSVGCDHHNFSTSTSCTDCIISCLFGILTLAIVVYWIRRYMSIRRKLRDSQKLGMNQLHIKGLGPMAETHCRRILAKTNTTPTPHTTSLADILSGTTTILPMLDEL